MQETLKRALTHYNNGQLQEALAVLQPLLLAGNSAEPVLALLGNIHAKLGNPAAAGDAFLRLSKMTVSSRAGYARLAVRMLNAARCNGDLAANAPGLLQSAGDDPETVFLVLSACEEEGQHETGAGSVYRLDLSNPHHAMLGLRLLRAAKRYGEVIPFLDEVLMHRPDDGIFNAERFSEALRICDFAVAAECEKAILDAESGRSANMLAAGSVHRRLMWTDDEALLARPGLEQQLIARQMHGVTKPPRRAISRRGERLRIAYLSNDFHGHATMTLLRQVLLEHDPDRFEIGLFCYTDAEKAHQQADWPEDLLRMIIQVRDLSDTDAAARISRWKADILVDLKGFTGGARLGIVRLSDAPVKVAWLGFPGSEPGLDIDYCISDHIVTPESSKPHFEEKLCRLPECYQPNDGVGRPLPQSATRADFGLPEDAFVFASFNTPLKVTRKMIRLWAQMLSAVEDSVFWCMASDQIARVNILAAFEEEGIGEGRIIFAEALAYAEHINRIPLADLAVDTFPCGGHTTTSDALWAGMPVLTLSGGSFASRVSASLLTAIGVPGLITYTEEDYLRRAVELATDPARLGILRHRIADHRFSSPLFDSERFARHLEKAFELMAERARDGLRPDHLDVPVLPSREGKFAQAG